MNDIRPALRIMALQVFEDVHLDLGLLVKPLLITNDFERDHTASLVVVALDDLAKRPFAERRHDLVAVGDVVARHNDVVAAFIVETVVAGFGRSDFAFWPGSRPL